jgi:hypothetical protein
MKVPSKVVLAVLAALVAGCADRGRAAQFSEAYGLSRVEAEHRLRENEGRGVDSPLVIVTIDGVRWQEVFGGTNPTWHRRLTAPSLLPHLYRLGFDRGAFVGMPGYGTISASGPNFVSLPGYTEILGGRPSIACSANDCERTRLPTILDEARAAGAKVAAFSSWEVLTNAATASPGAFRLSCGQDGEHPVDAFPGYGDYRPDRVTADAAFAYYRAEHPDVFFLGLGDTDEYAHRGDYARYIRALQEADDIVGRLMDLLDNDGERGARTHIVVTADHGRASNFTDHGAMPEASRVWMVAAGPRFGARGPTRSPRERHLADIVPTLRMVAGLAPDNTDFAGRTLDELFTGPASEGVEELRAASL